MSTIKKFIAVSAVAMGIAMPVSSFGQADAMTDGEIKKVDQATGKVTIKHGHIKSLDMPSMTMVFTAKDKNMLSNVKPGDKVKFSVVDEGGKMIVTDIQPAK